jgi:hypothetical protein
MNAGFFTETDLGSNVWFLALLGFLTRREVSAENPALCKTTISKALQPERHTLCGLWLMQPSIVATAINSQNSAHATEAD